ncbi:MAG: preprotein translocase subunit YajC [Nocardioidaceae bacterium]|nr:MAG: preprotein translocase subunit YajC [Nocardioidaceae bacterium]
MESLAALLPFLLIGAVFYLLMIRPAQRRQREAQAVQRSADIGAQVVLTSGIYGRVVTTTDEDVEVEIAPGTQIKVVRQAILRVIPEAIPDSAPGTIPDTPESLTDPTPETDTDR